MGRIADGAIWWNRGNGRDLASWPGWERLGTQTFRNLPSCVADGFARLHCFALGLTGWALPAGGGYPAGYASRYGPSCVFVRGILESRSFSTIHCLVGAQSETDDEATAPRGMWHRSLDVTNSRWSDRWQNHGGILLTAPECVPWGPNRLDCFVRGRHAGMHHKWWNGFRWGP